MMNKNKLIRTMVLLIIVSISLAACSKSYSENKYDAPIKSSDNKADYDEGASYDPPREPSPDDLGDSLSNTIGGSNELSMEKIIRRVNMDVETLEFDKLVNALTDKVTALGGYIEKSDISGRRYYSTNSQRYGRIIARIPKDKLDEFITVVEANEYANIVNRSEDTENVTLQYVDIESRKKSLEIEQDRLFELLEKADNIENIISLESRLSSIRYELQNYGTQLRTYDNLVDYSTVTLTIDEVERITPVTVEKETVWDRIGSGFSDTMYNISRGLQDFFVWFVVNLPYILIWTIIIISGILITRRAVRKSRRKNYENYKSMQENNNDNKEIDKKQ